MTEVLHSPSHFPSSPNTLFHTQTHPYNQNPNSNSVEEIRVRVSVSDSIPFGGGEERVELKPRDKQREELSLLALLLAVFRKSLIGCSASDRKNQISDLAMDISWPTNVRHVAHVTFDRFDGFLGLPVEFEPEVPRRAPSASTSVFGVSTESMQLSFDSRGNCVPTILILMQRRLYTQGGLQVEGIFRITADNSQEEFVRDQLNGGIIPDDIDVHCLAGLIKAWFRELPTGLLDPLSPDDVMRCDCEEDCTELVSQLPATEAALLDWAINLMADVVQEEQYNKMNAHNIAMVFAPNMTQMADPLTALMYAVRVMNFLKTLITKRLRDREDSRVDMPAAYRAGPSDENGHQSPSQPCLEDYLGDDTDGTESTEPEPYSSDDEPAVESPHDTNHYSDGDESVDSPFHWQSFKGLENSLLTRTTSRFHPDNGNAKNDQSSSSSDRKDLNLMNLNRSQPREHTVTEKPKRTSNLSRISSRVERIEAWR